MVAIQIRAQALRQGQPVVESDAAQGLAIFPDGAASSSSDGEGRGRTHWRQADVKRAIGAAEKAGLRSYRVEIAPDGTISIVVGATPEMPASPAN
jgi:hypothetical protein